MYKENRLVDGPAAPARRSASTSRDIEQNLLVVTAGADHIAPPPGTLPLLDLVSSEDVTHFDRPGGHIGLMAGSKAREEIWPDIVGVARRAVGPLARPPRGEEKTWQAAQRHAPPGGRNRARASSRAESRS